jgi:hypothetical protein
MSDSKDFDVLMVAARRALHEVVNLLERIEWYRWAQTGLTRLFQVFCARRYAGISCDEVEAEKVRGFIADCERAIEWRSERAKTLYWASFQWMKVALLAPGPEGEKKELARFINEIEADAEALDSAGGVAALSPDQCLAVIKHAGTETDRKIIDRILSVLESHGPLVTDRVIDKVGRRSSTRVKDLLSRLRKIGVIDNGPGGFALPSETSKDQSKD